MKRDVIAVVLAAGSGKRFWPFTTDKNIFPFLGRTYIDYTIGDTLPKEISRVVVIANERNKDILEKKKFGVPQSMVVQKEGDGMSEALRAASSLLTGKQVLIIIADDISHKNVFRDVLTKAQKGFFGVLPVWHATSHFPGGYIKYLGEKPKGIIEKPAEGKEPSDFVYFGGQYIESADELYRAIDAAKTASDDVYEQALSILMESNDFATVVQEEQFMTMKYPWHVLGVTDYLLRNRFVPGRGKHVEIKNNVVIEGPVYLGNYVRIMENTKIVGPVYIGDNTIVGNNNIIRDSYIGSDCVTGFNTDITRSYVGDHCWFHSNYIGDSVLEGNVSMGSGSVLANLRLDEGEICSIISEKKVRTGRSKLGAMIASNVRIGVNVSVMPGIKIGSNSMIGAGALLTRDVSEGTFVSSVSQLSVSKNTKIVKSAIDRNAFKSKL